MKMTMILPLICLCGGAILILLGILILLPLYGWRSVRVEAECISVDVIYHYSKRPVYRYCYDGKKYESGPLMTSNRCG